MPGIARAVVPEVPHHITQRGNRRNSLSWTNGETSWHWQFYEAKRVAS